MKRTRGKQMNYSLILGKPILAGFQSGTIYIKARLADFQLHNSTDGVMRREGVGVFKH